MKPELQPILKILRGYYGVPALPPAKGPFELVLWENACYLLPDERRAEVFEGLRSTVGLNAAAIASAPRERLLALAARGGMRPDTRVFRWLEIARITTSQFNGDLDQILDWPLDKAKRALKQFPTIGDPGAEKILAMCGRAEGLPLESNGLRVLTRLGYGRPQRSYAAVYRSVQEDLSGQVPSKAADLTTAHLLLKLHGKQLCKDKEPACGACPLAGSCPYPLKTGR